MFSQMYWSSLTLGLPFTHSVDDDILLEVVMFVGVLCNEGTAPLLVQSGLVSMCGSRQRWKAIIK